MKLLLLVTLLIPLSAYTDTVYKSMDEEGNIIFTDKPSEGAEKIEIKKAPAVNFPDVPAFKKSTSGKKDKKGQQRKVTISSPGNDETIQSNPGSLTVTTTLEGSLKENEELVLYMDGKKIHSGKSNQFSLTNIDRGTHDLYVELVSADGKTAIRSDKIQFHMRRVSKLKNSDSSSKSSDVTPLNPPKPGQPDVSPTNPPGFQPSAAPAPTPVP